MKRNLLWLIGSFILIVILLSSCSKEDGTGKLIVKLTDAPANLEAVNIDIQSVEVHISKNESENGWKQLDFVNPGIYNLLDFRNGLDTVLASGDFPVGKISQMRFVLGPDNSVVKDDKTYTLSVPSSMQSGLKFLINADIQDGIEYKIWIDFDAGRSLMEKSNGHFSLKPVIRTFQEATSGALKGVISPPDAANAVYLSYAKDTLSTIPEADGSFMFRGLSEGSWDLFTDPADDFSMLRRENIEIVKGQVKDLGTIDAP